ncbi:hypothetical protein V6N12_035888 [Hibiscus sabdariffa]|uniref:Agglutinin domain-containing protein n=1 Tax=Hibiscus sabdariffa TaxID=183260 RepID=A0ABR2ERI7_9ROSI
MTKCVKKLWLVNTRQKHMNGVGLHEQHEMESKESADGLFHIRSCQNNKYWERSKNISITGNPAEEYWITATANSKEEDQSKASCTLFKFFSVDPATNSVQILHVQSGCYLCQWALASPTYGGCVLALANYQIYDHQGCDSFQLIDWSSRKPTISAVCGYRHRPCEIFVANDGTIRIKTTCIDKFWRRSTNNWIWADSDDTSTNDKDTLYRGVQVDGKTIGLINLGNNYFCKRLTTHVGQTNCLNAALPTVTTEGRITVEEPVLRREINDVKYDVDDSRVYDQKSLILATNSVVNSSPEPATLHVKLSYVDTTARTWSTNFSLKLDMKSTVDLSVPLISAGGEVEISDEVQSGVVWGDTYASTKVVQVVHNVVVPAMTKVRVNLVASKGTCDVPFTFTQRDTLYDGTIVQAEINGSYTGSNYYNIIETKEESVE